MTINAEIAGGFVAGLIAKEFRLVLDAAIFKPISVVIAKQFHKWEQQHPLHWQPFRHYQHRHPGKLKYCKIGLCKVL